MIDFYKIIDNIKSTLTQNGYEEHVKKISDIVQGGSTGGEILAGVGFYIKHLDKKAPEAHKLIKEQAELFINELEKLGGPIK